MTKDIKVDVNKTGFPVRIGSIELWFDSSLENLRTFFNVEKIAQERLKEAKEKAQHIHFPDGLEDINLEDTDNETIIDDRTADVAVDVFKEFVAAQYDIVFGDNTFKKVYKKYPDIMALERALVVASEAISNQIEEANEELSERTEVMKEEYLNKKDKKKMVH